MVICWFGFQAAFWGSKGSLKSKNGAFNWA
jgi:hypothetical protein